MGSKLAGQAPQAVAAAAVLGIAGVLAVLAQQPWVDASFGSAAFAQVLTPT